MSREAYFWERVCRKEPDQCWPWIGPTNSKGYGIFRYDRGTLAHRFSLSTSLGRPIAHGMNVLHSCDNPVCVNPSHLREGTQKDNVRDMMERERQKTGPRGFKYNHGTRAGMAKLTEDIVWNVKYGTLSSLSHKDTAKILSVHPSVVCTIRNGKAWVHVDFDRTW